MKVRQKLPEKIWQDFQHATNLTDHQVALFERYADFLLSSNENFNLTAITDLSGVLRNHFQDSLEISRFMDMSTVSCLADIGTGAGFPALPLKIVFPHLQIKLIEVTKKKQQFLAQVVEMLGMEQVEILDLDWRTFLRTTSYPIDLFVTRAALEDLELIRMFQPASPYRNATLVYWASTLWEPHKRTTPFIRRQEAYKMGPKERKLIFMSLPEVPNK